MNKEKKIKVNSISYFFLLFYFIAITTYQLGTGFDALFVRATFIIWFIITLILNRKIEMNDLLKWGLLFWGFYFLSMIWASDSNDTLYYLNNCIQIIGIFICIPLITKKVNNINTILILIIISLVYSCLVLLIRTPKEIWGTDYIGMVMGLHRNAIGLRLSIGFLICIYFIHLNLENIKKINIKVALLALISILFASIALLTGSKKAFLSLFLGFISFEIINSKGVKIVFKIIIIAFICSFLIYYVFNNELLYSALGNRIEHMILTIQGNNGVGQTDGSLLERQYYINQAKYLFSKYPLFGYGGNNFVTFMREIKYKHIAYSHNNFWELLSTLGIVGFVIYYYMWIKMFICYLKNYKEKKKLQSLLFLIIIFIIIILDYGNVSYITDFNMIIFALSYSCYLKLNCNEEVENE